MPIVDGEERPPDPVEDDQGPEAPNEGSPGHHPDAGDLGEDEDEDAADSFPASDPPANY